MTRGALLAVAALAFPAAALAVPPTGPADNPGTPPASVATATTTVAPHGTVSFTGAGFLNADGKPQKVYVKVDDAGTYGIGPFLAAADGSLGGSVSLDDAEAPKTASDLGEHHLRFLTGPSGDYPDNGPARSIRAPFTVAPAAAAAPAPPAPQAPAGPVAAPPVTFALGAFRLRWPTTSRKVPIRLSTSAPAGAQGSVVVVSRDRLAVPGRGGKARIRLAQGRFTLAGTGVTTVRLDISAAGKRLLAPRRARPLPARLTVTSTSGAALTSNVVLQRATR